MSWWFIFPLVTWSFIICAMFIPKLRENLLIGLVKCWYLWLQGWWLMIKKLWKYGKIYVIGIGIIGVPLIMYFTDKGSSDYYAINGQVIARDLLFGFGIAWFKLIWIICSFSINVSFIIIKLLLLGTPPI